MAEPNKKRIRVKGIIFDILIIIVLLGAFYPIFDYYYHQDPPLGADFYQLTTYSKYMADHPAFPPASWKYVWFDGLPMINDYAGLFFLIGSFFVKVWGLIAGSKICMMLTTFLFFVFSYFFLKELSRSRWFSLAGTVSLMWTLNVYDALMSGGNTTFSATQLFLPLVMWMIIKYYRTRVRRYFWLAVFFAGLSYWGHAGASLLFIYIPGLIFVFFWWDKKFRLFSWQKVKDTLFFFLVVMCIGFLALWSVAIMVLTIPALAEFSLTGEGARPHAVALEGTFGSQNLFLYVGLFILLFLALSRNYFEGIKKFLPFAAVIAYLLFFEWLYVIGHNPFAGALFPSRTYWVMTFFLVGMAAVAWDIAFNKYKEIRRIYGFHRITFTAIQILVVLVVLLSPLTPYSSINERIFKVNPHKLGISLSLKNYYFPALTTLEGPLRIDDILAQKKITQEDKDRVIGKLVPEYLNPDDREYRLHTLRVGINTWWSSIFKMPLAHGAYSARNLDSQNWSYWTDVAIHGELVAHWEHPLKIAKQDTLFLMDWRGIRYLFGQEKEVKEEEEYEYKQTEDSDWPLAVADYLTRDQSVIDRVGLEDEPIVSQAALDETKGQLTFYRFKEDVVSPLAKTTNVPAMLVIGHKRVAFDNVFRNLGHLNLNSRYIVPVKGPESLNKVSLDDLRKFDVVYLQYYQSSLGAWGKLEKYVREGGSVIIDTGGEVKESDTQIPGMEVELPEVFPISQTTRKSLGTEWNPSYNKNDPLFRGVNFSEFGDLVFEGTPWKLSYSEPHAVKSWARAVLSQQDKPVVVAGELDKGKVVWLGLNFSYHYNTYHSLAEAQFFKNILASMVDLEDEGVLDFEVERPKPEKVIITGENVSGAVLKENNYGGWTARMVEPYKKNLKIFVAGPTYSYVRLPSDVNGPVKIEFNYRGTFFNWFFFLVAVFFSLSLLSKVIFGERKIPLIDKINIYGKIKQRLRKKTAAWWDKDEEE